MRRFLKYAGARIRERSTIAAISSALPTAVNLGAPWCWIIILAAIGVALMPTSSPASNSNGAAQ